jgi:hypothetical protein
MQRYTRLQILEKVDHYTSIYRKNKKKFKELIIKQMKSQTHIIETSVPCESQTLDSNKMKLLSSYLRTEYGLEVQKFLHCHLLDLMKYVDEWQKLKQEYTFGTWKQYGDKPVYGSMIRGGQFDNIVIKSSIDDEDTLIHECFVGLMALNSLRSEIPNFSLALGITRCGHNYNSKQEPLQCLAGDTYNLVYERCSGEQFRKMMKQLKNKKVLCEIMLQILLALQLAWEKFEYTHYDLHDENIMIQELTDFISIKYELKSQTYYLKTKYVVSFIDYGMSHVKIGEQHYGNYSFLKLMYGPHRGNPAVDVLNIMSNLIRSTMSSNKKHFKGKTYINVFAELGYPELVDFHNIVKTMVVLEDDNRSFVEWYLAKKRDDGETFFMYPYDDRDYLHFANMLMTKTSNWKTQPFQGVKIFKSLKLPQSVISAMEEDNQISNGNLIAIGNQIDVLDNEGIMILLKKHDTYFNSYYNKFIAEWVNKLNTDVGSIDVNKLKTPQDVYAVLDNMSHYFDAYMYVYNYFKLCDRLLKYDKNNQLNNLPVLRDKLRTSLIGKLSNYQRQYNKLVKMFDKLDEDTYDHDKLSEFEEACHPDKLYILSQ